MNGGGLLWGREHIADPGAMLTQNSSFDGFSLSNMLDAVPPAYKERLLAAVRRAAAPGAVLVLRSFWEPGDGAAAQWAARDRSLLWGAIQVMDIAKIAGSAAR